MKRQRIVLVVTGILILSWGSEVQARGTTVSGPAAGVVVTSHGGLGIWIGGGPLLLPHRPPLVHREIVIPRPWHERFLRLGHPPVKRIEPVIVPRPPPVPCANGPVTVWITNSNGSRTSVRLTKQGHWYIGPRGEYYSGRPTNEQLRVVYGF